MNLREQRCLFTLMVGELIVWVPSNLPEHALALAEVKRTKAQADANAASGAGISNSLHLLGLAVDFDLYVDGVYQESSEAHARIGEKWKSMHPLNRWGGDFRNREGKPKPDGNHYSSERDGVK